MSEETRRDETGTSGGCTQSPAVVLKWPMPMPVMAFEMPEGAEVIEVATQDGTPTMWTLSRANVPTERRTFIGFGTGHPILEDGLTFVGTAHEVEGAGLVFHIFERPNSASSFPSEPA